MRNSYITIKYEDIITKFDSTIKKILNFTDNNYEKYLKNKDLLPIFDNRNEVNFFDDKYKKEFNYFFQKYFKDFNYENL